MYLNKSKEPYNATFKGKQRDYVNKAKPLPTV